MYSVPLGRLHLLVVAIQRLPSTLMVIAGLIILLTMTPLTLYWVLLTVE